MGPRVLLPMPYAHIWANDVMRIESSHNLVKAIIDHLRYP